MKNLVGTIVKLKNGEKGKVACELKSGEYLLMQNRGGWITQGFMYDDVAEFDLCDRSERPTEKAEKEKTENE